MGGSFSGCKEPNVLKFAKKQSEFVHNISRYSNDYEFEAENEGN